jgi:hypothetical protein
MLNLMLHSWIGPKKFNMEGDVKEAKGRKFLPN